MKERRCYEIMGASSASEHMVYWNSTVNRNDMPTGNSRERLHAYLEAASA